MAAQMSRIRTETGPAKAPEPSPSPASPSRQGRIPPVRRLDSPAQALGRRMSAILPLLQAAPQGAPLNPAIRAPIERSLGANLGDVGVHQGGQASAAVGGLAARAVTVGSNIVLGAGENDSDLGLMAHESAHVLQQRGATPRPQGFTGAEGGLETEANAAAQAVTQGSRFAVTGRTSGLAVQREEEPWYRRAGRAVGSTIGGAVEFGESVGWRMLGEFAPELVPIIRQGPAEWLKEKISTAVESVFNTLMAPVRSLTGIASSLTGHFANLVAWIRQAAARIAAGDCGAVTEAAEKIQQVFEGLAAPVIDRIKHLADRVKNFFSGLWERFGAPVWQFLQRVGGAAWEQIQRLGRWIWEKTAPIRRVLDRAWTWVKDKLGIGEGAEGQDGILQWVQRKAQSVWDEHVKPFYERYRRQILIVAGVLAMLSPAGPVIAVAAAIGGLAAGIRWIRQNLRNREAIVRQRGVFQGVIIPGILGAVNRVSSFLVQKARFIAGKLTEIVGGLNQALGTLAGSVLGFAVGILQWIVARFQELVAWAIQGLTGLANGVAGALDRLRVYLQPILDVLRQIAQVVGNIMRLPMLLAGRLWNLIPACIRNPFINFFIPLILRQIAFFRELAATPEAWQQTRAEVMRLIQQVFRNFDLLGAIRSAFRLVVRALRIPVGLVGQLLEKAAAAWDAVIRAPLRFIENALKSILQGVGRFMRNILSHLWYGVQGWLFNAVSQGGVAVSPPASWTDPRAVFGFVLGVLGISVNHVIELINRRIPGAGRVLQQGRRLLTGALAWLDIALTQGPRGVWQHLAQAVGNLGTLVLESAVGWIMTRVVAIVGARLAALAATAGVSAVLEAIKAVYSAIQAAIEFMPRILGILIRVFDTVTQIAAGVIGPAAAMVESGFRMAMPIVIGFLANYAGLGGIGGRIVEIIRNVRQRIDNAILALIDRAIGAIRRVWDMLRRGVQALRDWWRERRPFRSANRVNHTLLFHGQGAAATLHVASVERPLQEYLGRIDASAHADRIGRIRRIQGEIESLRTRTVEHSSGREEVRLAQPGLETGERISALLRDLATELEGLPDPDAPAQNLVMPPSTIVQRETQTTSDARAGLSGNSTDGKVMEIKPLSINPGALSGSEASRYSPLYNAVARRSGTYVAGHLLSAHVHGPGNEFWNLTPITQAANRSMSSGAERSVHELVFNMNKIVHYVVTVHYPNSPAPGPVIAAEGFLPNQLSFTLKTMRLKPSVEAAAASTPDGINQARSVAANWEDDPASNVPSPAAANSNPPLTQPTNIETLNTATRDSIISKTTVTQAFAGALVSYQNNAVFNNKADFLAKMATAATTKILKINFPSGAYDPTQDNINVNSSKVANVVNEDLTWKT